MLRRIFTAAVLFTVIALLPNNLFSQAFQCPPDAGVGCSPWQPGNYTTDTQGPDCHLVVKYRWRNCNGNYQIYIDNVEKTGNCEYLGGGTNMTAFQEWLDLVLIEEVADLSAHYPPANCPDSSQKVIFYTASCGKWVKCEYSVNLGSRVCDVDWRGAFPDYVFGNQSKVSVSQFQSCGITCCKKTYVICKSYNPGGMGYDIIIRSLSKQKVGECSNPDGLQGPCTDGC